MDSFFYVPAYGYAVRVFYLANDDDAMQATYAVDISKRIEHEILIVLHVFGIYFYLEIVVASGIVTFGYLFYLLHGVHELLYQVMCVLFQSDVAQHDDVVAQFVVVHHCRIPCYVTLAFQPFLSFKGGGGGQMHAGGKFLDGHVRVLLQQF